MATHSTDLLDTIAALYFDESQAADMRTAVLKALGACNRLCILNHANTRSALDVCAQEGSFVEPFDLVCSGCCTSATTFRKLQCCRSFRSVAAVLRAMMGAPVTPCFGYTALAAVDAAGSVLCECVKHLHVVGTTCRLLCGL